jgi:hypothetical protein
MVLVRTDFGNLKESARRERFEPDTGIGGTLTATNVQKAIEALDTLIATLTTPAVPLTLAGGIVVKVRSSSAASVTLSPTTDYYLSLDPTSNAITVNLPTSPTTGLTYLIKDSTGQAGTHNITVTPAAGNIDGSATFVMNINFQSVGVTYTGTQWSLD